MNLTQVILVVVITTLTILLTFIGIQVVYILRDFREILKRVNKIVDNAEAISSAVVRPVTGISALVEGIQSSLKIAELVGHFKKGSKEVAQEIPEKVREIKADVREAKEQIEKVARIREEKTEIPSDDEELEVSGDGEVKKIPVVTSRSPGRRFFFRRGAPLA